MEKYDYRLPNGAFRFQIGLMVKKLNKNLKKISKKVKRGSEKTCHKVPAGYPRMLDQNTSRGVTLIFH